MTEPVTKKAKHVHLKDTGVQGTAYPKPYDPNAPPEPIITVINPPVDVEPEADETPVEVPVKEKETTKKPKLIGIRDWKESIEGSGVTPERLRDCIIFHLDVSKDKWWVPRINTGRGFLRGGKGKIARMLDDSVPKEYTYEADSVVGWKSKPIEDSEDRTVVKFVRRQPNNDDERELIRAHFGVTKYSRRYLAKKDCKKCSGTGKFKAAAYADNPKLLVTVVCSCIEE